MKIQSHLRQYDHIMHGESSQIVEVMKVEISGKRKKVDQGNRGKSV